MVLQNIKQPKPLSCAVLKSPNVNLIGAGGLIGAKFHHMKTFFRAMTLTVGIP